MPGCALDHGSGEFAGRELAPADHDRRQLAARKLGDAFIGEADRRAQLRAALLVPGDRGLQVADLRRTRAGGERLNRLQHLLGRRSIARDQRECERP